MVYTIIALWKLVYIEGTSALQHTAVTPCSVMDSSSM